MYHARMRTACIALGLLISLACSSQAQQPGDVAARVGDHAITVKELDDRWQKEEPAQKAQAEQAIYDGRRSALDAIIADMLVEQAAKSKGISAHSIGSHRRTTQQPSDHDQFGQRPYAHFLHNPLSMRFDRPCGRAQFKRNLLVDLASYHQVVNLSFTRRQHSNTSAQEVQLALEL